MGQAKELTGPYEVAAEKHCHCVVKAPVSGQDFTTGWGWRLCRQCKGFIGWGVKG